MAFALPAHALTFPYEAVGQGGTNGILDSNGESCDNSPFEDPAQGNGVAWPAGVGGEGCYNRTGGKCSADPNHMCDPLLVPAGRCSYGSLLAGGSDSGLSCLFPRGAGHCVSDTHVGCLSDAYVANPILANAVTGASTMCSSLASNSCDMTTDVYGRAFRQGCQCDGTVDVNSANGENTVCGTDGGQLKAVCSDGDPTRDVGGYGTALGVELDLAAGPGNTSFANMGPSQNGKTGPPPSTSPPYAIEGLVSDDTIEPQRKAGTINRGDANTTPIGQARTTDARDIDPNFNAALGVSKIVNFGDSYWADWVFISKKVGGVFNTHIVVFPCDPPVSWNANIPIIDPTPANHISGDETWCSQIGRNGVTFEWSRDLTPTELQNNPSCPPNCKKDFDITTYELQAFISAGQSDPDAGAQIAIQSGEGRQAGAGDAIGVAEVTSETWLTTGDMRCRLGGWGNPAGFIGRCTTSSDACIPGDPTSGDTFCTGLGAGLCAACNGPIYSGNPNGLPIGYNTHGLSELDLVAHQRLGGISGPTSAVAVPLFVVGTTGYAASDFRDVSGGTANNIDLSDMGAVDPTSNPLPGIGTGATFAPGTLPIGEFCCSPTPGAPAGGSPVGVNSAHLGTPLNGATYNRVFDRGPGPDGIPGCTNNTNQQVNGQAACKKRLGKGPDGSKTDGFFATGLDDVPTTYPVGTSGTIAASANRFPVRNATPAVVAYFSGPPYNLPNPNPLTINTIASFTLQDLSVLGPNNADILVKVNSTFCPIVGNAAVCSPAVACSDVDQDGVCDAQDNCPTVANANQADADGDLVGDACDNCVNAFNARVPGWTLATGSATYLAANPWATLTGGQRDDDHDGFGNVCDGDFPGTSQGGNVGPADTAQYRTALGKSRATDTCGSTGTRPCAIFDIDLNDTGATTNIGPADTARYRLLLGFPAGPKCAACPLPCEAGPSGTCS
ncbi:MAG TPA: hypothetical protein VMR50_20230 [Myxococcota bacterium]|nr:hypothetical protein [Myxococcota bacterium]